MTGLPLLATDDVQLRWARPEVLESSRHRMLRLLTLAERLRYEATPLRARRDSFLLGRVLVRELAAEALGIDPIEVGVEAHCVECGGPHGRPEVVGAHPGLARLRVSIAHCEGAVVAALTSDRSLGVDIERARVLETDGATESLRLLRTRAVLKAVGSTERSDAEGVRFRTRDGATEAWVDGAEGYFAVSEPAVHPALVVSLALADA